MVGQSGLVLYFLNDLKSLDIFLVRLFRTLACFFYFKGKFILRDGPFDYFGGEGGDWKILKKSCTTFQQEENMCLAYQ